jgi:hypothetical protein
MTGRRLVARGIAFAAVAAVVLSTSPAASADVTSGLVLGYGFERLSQGRVVDSSPSLLDGTRHGSPKLPGQVAGLAGHGKALSFDSAQQQFVDAGDSAPLDVNRFTLAAWVRYLPKVHDDRWEVLEKAGAYWMNIRTDTRRLRVGGFFGGCVQNRYWIYLDSVRTIPAYTWVHVAGTYDGSALRIYVNGVLDASRPVTGTTCANSEPLAVGAKNRTVTGVTEAYFDGRLDDVRVYGRALSAAEIKTVRTSALT